ncbi:hypothetical protein ACJW30_11G031500 [Castanea mollissima]
MNTPSKPHSLPHNKTLSFSFLSLSHGPATVATAQPSHRRHPISLYRHLTPSLTIVLFSLSRSPSPRSALLSFSLSFSLTRVAWLSLIALPEIIRANAKLVYACEWNPNAIEALQHNLQANSVIDCCIVLEEDNRITHLKVLLIVFVLVSFQQVRVAGSPL